MTPPHSPRFFQFHSPDSEALKAEAAAGLRSPSAHISPKFFYDQIGSKLFEAITELTEYYPTRTETAILDRHAADMARVIGTGSTLIDLGAGNCAKAMRLIPTFEPSRYVAVDISVDFLRDALAQVQRAHPALEVMGVGMDFSSSLDLPDVVARPARPSAPVFFYPGSSIGNFTPKEALNFLQRVRQHAGGGGLLIGVDLHKPAEELVTAYDDALGVTAAFNLNVLRCLNRLLGSDFDPRRWVHLALFNEAESRVEMHLQARLAHTVRWPDGERRFAQGERIHTENSCKWTLQGFTQLLQQAGFGLSQHWTDEQQRFAVFWAPA